jgi:hypothetical protein
MTAAMQLNISVGRSSGKMTEQSNDLSPHVTRTAPELFPALALRSYINTIQSRFLDFIHGFVPFRQGLIFYLEVNT